MEARLAELYTDPTKYEVLEKYALPLLKYCENNSLFLFCFMENCI